jgi:hypothetical protein
MNYKFIDLFAGAGGLSEGFVLPYQNWDISVCLLVN